MLNTNGTRQRRAASRPAAPSVSGGDMASTAPGGRGRPRSASAVDSRVKPAKAAARAGMLRLSVGNGWTRDAAPLGVLVADHPALPPGLDAVVLVPRQGRDDVRRGPATSSVAMLVITSPVGAVSARGGAQHEQLHVATPLSSGVLSSVRPSGHLAGRGLSAGVSPGDSASRSNSAIAATSRYEVTVASAVAAHVNLAAEAPRLAQPLPLVAVDQHAGHGLAPVVDPGPAAAANPRPHHLGQGGGAGRQHRGTEAHGLGHRRPKPS